MQRRVVPPELVFLSLAASFSRGIIVARSQAVASRHRVDHMPNGFHTAVARGLQVLRSPFSGGSVTGGGPITAGGPLTGGGPADRFHLMVDDGGRACPDLLSLAPTAAALSHWICAFVDIDQKYSRMFYCAFTAAT